MAQICPACNTSNPDTARVCNNCQAPLPGAEAPDPAAKLAVPGAARRSASAGAIAEAARRAEARKKAAEAAAAAQASGTPAPGARLAGSPRPAAPARPPVRGVTAPINAALDRAGLPRFSTQRYLVIWAGFAILLLLVIAALVAVGASNARNPVPTPQPGAVLTGTVVTVETTKGIFKIQLTDNARMKATVANFRTKVASGYYDNKTFHRVEDWIVQGGAPRCDAGDTRGCATGGGTLAGEYDDKLPFIAGTIGMAAASPHAAQANDSQWFVVKKAAPNLTNNYPVVGTVTEGLDVVGKLTGCKPKEGGSQGDLDCTAADKMLKVTLGSK